MVASSLKDLPDSVVPAEGFAHGLLRTAAIYGANASGKTNVIKALLFACLAVGESHASWKPERPVPHDPFVLDRRSAAMPSSFAFDLLLDRTRYQYTFSISRDGIEREEFSAFPKGRKQRWYLRQAGGPILFSKKLLGENRAIESMTRRNSLFLSAAAQNGHQMLTPIYRWFLQQSSFVMRERRFEAEHTAKVCKDPRGKAAVWKLLSGADFGLTGLEVKELTPDERTKKVVEALRGAMPELAAPDLSGKKLVLRLQHKGHGGQPVEFPLSKESDGTLAYIGILGSVVSALRDGETLCIDELDASLHPRLSSEIVKLFNNPRRNRRAAQLIFTTHDTSLLDSSLLRRDQVWFTEKDGQGATHLYPLTDYRPRKHENVRRGYIQGRYGAVPFTAGLGDL